MEPTLKSGQIVWVNHWIYFINKVKISDIVVFEKDKQELVKRVANILNDKIFLTGDNQADSLDSKSFGEIPKKDIKGKVMV